MTMKILTLTGVGNDDLKALQSLLGVFGRGLDGAIEIADRVRSGHEVRIRVDGCSIDADQLRMGGWRYRLDDIGPSFELREDERCFQIDAAVVVIAEDEANAITYVRSLLRDDADVVDASLVCSEIRSGTSSGDSFASSVEAAWSWHMGPDR